VISQEAVKDGLERQENHSGPKKLWARWCGLTGEEKRREESERD
jgi:hypothetical protein